MRTVAIIAVVLAAAFIIQFLLNKPEPANSAKWDVFRDCLECPEMVVVPPGSFSMGSPPGEAGRYGDEGPQHMVSISAPFAVGKFEVTFEEWDACVVAGSCGGYIPDDEGWGRGTRPVINVSWNEAKLYIDWLNSRVAPASGDGGDATVRPYRLLTEAEWEYAARAGTTTRYSWGDGIGRGNANCDAECADDFANTAPVGSFLANEFGLHDMHGNVYEWVEDCYHEDYEGAPVKGEAWLAGGDCEAHYDVSRDAWVNIRVLRGGYWNDYPWSVRSAFRNWSFSWDRNNSVGFRVARTL